MVNSRRKLDLVDEAYDLILRWESHCFAIGIPVMITSTLRDKEYQEYLYAQGRTRPGKIVTWTHNSRHLPDASGKSRAWDFAVLKDGAPCWDVKTDINDNDIPDYLDAAQVARDLGLVAGADFKDKKGGPQPDLCHIELKGDNK